MNIAKDKLHKTLNLADKLGLEECSHHIRYADDCAECERVWDEAYPPTISKAAYDGAREDLLIWKKRALEAGNQLAAMNAGLAVTEVMVLKAVYDSGLHQYAPGVLRTSWKDGIDLDVPCPALMNFAGKICKAANVDLRGRAL